MRLSLLTKAGQGLIQRLTTPEAIAVEFFEGTKNVGDQLNPYMLPKITGWPIYRASSSLVPHLRAIGSLIGSATFMSTIWGAGSIDGVAPRHRINPSRVHALRGAGTFALLDRLYGIDRTIPLGDPALLMPRYFNPMVERRYDVAVIPHFSETEAAANIVAQSRTPMLRVLDVRSDPEAFVTQLCECRAVLSSSLHGLILADAYEVPNVWVSFGGRLLGGEWKFYDYYSVTDAAAPARVDASTPAALDALVESHGALAKVHRYMYSTDDLLAAFPGHLIKV
ncbi:polysaccharide pyruvyl transferase family protein [Amorphus sp. 3PC139-8]|uniref:polysaccharide pyruvyl transferase family protein n=1 Tax=Amorphus sp. 3PC139-8 TaxID=2735676 RepID=UPI00345CE721